MNLPLSYRDFLNAKVVMAAEGGFDVPFRALKHRRKGRAVELNPAYFRDGCAHVARMAEELATPDLFGVIGIEAGEKVDG